MILIADSGTTKTDWRAVGGGTALSISTGGINPVFSPEADVLRLLKAELAPKLGGAPERIYFYGAGARASEAATEAMSANLKAVFPSSECFVESDLLGAARALCGGRAGIACILGTGSNTCLFDGENIAAKVMSGGFILGDEGAGSNFGKLLICDFVKGMLPADLLEKFQRKFALDYFKIIDAVYRTPMPNRYLASFAPFMLENISHPHVMRLVDSSFDAFFERNISHYDFKTYEVGAVGSVAHFFEPRLRAAADRFGARIGKILRSPVDALAEYHLKRESL